MTAFLQICGTSFPVKDWFMMVRRMVFALGPRASKNVTGMSSGPTAPFLFVSFSALSSSSILKSLHTPSWLTRSSLHSV